MKTLNRSTQITALFVPLIIGALLLIGVVSCKKDGTAPLDNDIDYYTCTMHPSVHSHDPGKCPICSMDLVPVKKKGSAKLSPEKASEKLDMSEPQKGAMGDVPGMGTTKPQAKEDGPTEFTVPVTRQQQIGVTYAAIDRRPFTHTVRAAGLVAYDKQRHWDYVARVEGYVKELFVFSRGERVEKGAPLLSFYSPDLLTTQNEFVNLLKTRDEAQGDRTMLESTTRLLESARQRLHLWNITDEQIAELEKTRKPSETLILRSPFAGVVQDLLVDQGRRVMAGDHLVDVVDLSEVWVWAQFYQDELPMLKKGLAINISTASYPGESFPGKISLVDPFINEATRTGRVRIDVENADFKLRPDMFVDADLTMDMGEGIAVPFSAVLPTGQHDIVFVDKGGGKLEPRFVELGRKYGDYYELKSGLRETERVVTSANFLIDAEAKVQGALKSW